jgi:hypothetical protein
VEAQRAIRLAYEHAVEHERVKVEVKIHRPAEPLHARHHAGLSAGEPLPPGLAAIGAAERAHEAVQDGATQPMIVGQPVAQPVRDREHPLAHGHVGGQHVIYEVRCALGHSPSPAARTDRAPLAREGHQPLERAVPAPDAREAMGQHPAAQEFPELVDDEAGKTTAVRFGVHGCEELGEVRAHDAVQHTRRRRSGHVGGGHAIVRSGLGASQDRAGSTLPTFRV